MSPLRPSLLVLGYALLAACERGPAGAADVASAPPAATLPPGPPPPRPGVPANPPPPVPHREPQFFPRAGRGVLQAEFATGGPPPGRGLEIKAEFARSYMEEGRLDEAVAAIEPLCAKQPNNPVLQYMRGLIHLRRSEVQNCVLRHNADCCVFPLKDGGVHAQREPAEKAREAFTRFAKLQPDDLRGRWLLNLLAMALGDYPDAVPAELRIPNEAFDSEYDVGRFTDVAEKVGLDTLNLAGGAVIEDFDGDGLLDVITSSLG